MISFMASVQAFSHSLGGMVLLVTHVKNLHGSESAWVRGVGGASRVGAGVVTWHVCRCQDPFLVDIWGRKVFLSVLQTNRREFVYTI